MLVSASCTVILKIQWLSFVLFVRLILETNKQTQAYTWPAVVLREKCCQGLIQFIEINSPGFCFLKELCSEVKMSSKRNLEEDTVEGLSKKIKVEQKLISDNITKNYPDIDITEHEIKKFVLIFHLLLLMTSLNNDELTELKALDTEDGVQDTILLTVMKLLSLLKGNIETLKLPKLIKIGLKKLESILFLTSNDGTYKDDIEDSIRSEKKTASATTTIAEISSKTWTVESAQKTASST